MKKSLFLIMLSVVSVAWSHLSAVTHATKWHSVKMHTCQYTTTSFQSVTYYTQGDTTYGDTIYCALYRNEGEYCGGLRQSANHQQIYIRLDGKMINGQSGIDYGEYLLYQFDVELGDTVWAYDHSYAGIDPMNKESEITQYRWIVQKILTINDRKHVWVRGGQSEHEVEWIEGVGSNYTFFENNYLDVLGGTYSTWALCAVDSEGNVIYSFDTDHLGIHNDKCDWNILAVENISAANPSATKLLRDGQLYIQNGDKIYNAEGIRIK